MNKRYINLTTGKSCEYYDTEEFCIFKLNGSIGYYTMLRTMMIVDNNTNEFNVGLLEEIIDRYEDFKKKKIDPLLDFAWILEKTYGNGYFDIILNSIKETNILVVIGYSFPFFNRIIDKEIINKMGNLQKVYFQSPDPEPMKERFFALRNDISNNELDKNLFLIRDKEQFFIPFELE
ncbi:MAG: hypothetical protein U5K32_12885 [Bacteroidales bacterium]|nr:hypothetical protein [Bacteroidales bacterium]